MLLLQPALTLKALYYLQRKKISCVFAGATELDFHLAPKQLASLFPIKTPMPEGGALWLKYSFASDQ